MLTLGKTIVLFDGEEIYKDCTHHQVNEAQNIISIIRDKETNQETIKILKLRNRQDFKELNTHML
jgi:hypothetical protein